MRPGSIWDRSFPERTYWGFQGPFKENDGTCAANRGSRWFKAYHKISANGAINMLYSRVINTTCYIGWIKKDG